MDRVYLVRTRKNKWDLHVTRLVTRSKVHAMSYHNTFRYCQRQNMGPLHRPHLLPLFPFTFFPLTFSSRLKRTLDETMVTARQKEREYFFRKEKKKIFLSLSRKLLYSSLEVHPKIPTFVYIVPMSIQVGGSSSTPTTTNPSTSEPVRLLWLSS